MTLVLPGGGVGAIAWTLGVLQGLADTDAALAQKVIGADTVIGTSGGSTVAVQITSGRPLEELYEAQLSAATAEIDVKLDLTDFMKRFGAAVAGAVDEMDRRRRVGAFALAAPTVSESRRSAVIAARLPTADWPERDLRIPAVDASTGEVVIFTRGSGVRLVDAVAASCAIPGIWPPVSIGERRYVDGGVRSSTNADLAAGADQILLITPTQADVQTPSLGGRSAKRTAGTKRLTRPHSLRRPGLNDSPWNEPARDRHPSRSGTSRPHRRSQRSQRSSAFYGLTNRSTPT
jgi:NTE family protein